MLYLDLANISLGFIDISTRPSRRKAVERISGVLGFIYAEEEAYMKRIPLNLKNSQPYSNADDTLYYLINAIFALYEAY